MFSDNRLWSRTAGRGWGSSARPQSRRLRNAIRRWGRPTRPLVRRSPERRQGHFVRRRSEERERRERYLDPCVHQARSGYLVLVYCGPRDCGGWLRFLLKPSFVIRNPEIAVGKTKRFAKALRVLRQQTAGAFGPC